MERPPPPPLRHRRGADLRRADEGRRVLRPGRPDRRLHRPGRARLRRARLRRRRAPAGRPRDRGEPLAGDPLRDERPDDRLPPRGRGGGPGGAGVGARLDRAGPLAAGDRGRAARAQRRPAGARGARRRASRSRTSTGTPWRRRSAPTPPSRPRNRHRDWSRGENAASVYRLPRRSKPAGGTKLDQLLDRLRSRRRACLRGGGSGLRTDDHPAPAREVAGQRAHAGNLGRGAGGRQRLPAAPVHDHRRGRRAARDRALDPPGLQDRDRLRDRRHRFPARPGSSA